jgi:hypothetical protein
MSLIAEVAPKLVPIAGRVAARSELLNIVLVDGRATLSPNFVAGGCHFSSEGLSVQVQRHRGRVWIRDKNILCTLIRFTFTATEKGGKGKHPLLNIAATILAEYQLAEGFVPSPEEQNAFLAANAVFNCWPYWREFVQSTAGRMSLPPLTLPFFRVRPKEPEKTKLLGEGKK